MIDYFLLVEYYYFVNLSPVSKIHNICKKFILY